MPRCNGVAVRELSRTRPKRACSTHRPAPRPRRRHCSRDGFDDPPVPWSRPRAAAAAPSRATACARVFVPQLGAFRDYLVHLPPQYDPARAWPVIVVLHGAGGPVRRRPPQAAARATWSLSADASRPSSCSRRSRRAAGRMAGRRRLRRSAARARRRSRPRTTSSAAANTCGAIRRAATSAMASCCSTPRAGRAYGVNAGVLQAYAGIGAPPTPRGRDACRCRSASARLDPLLPHAQLDRAASRPRAGSKARSLAYGEFPAGHVYGRGRRRGHVAVRLPLRGRAVERTAVCGRCGRDPFGIPPRPFAPAAA